MPINRIEIGCRSKRRRDALAENKIAFIIYCDDPSHETIAITVSDDARQKYKIELDFPDQVSFDQIINRSGAARSNVT